MQSEQARRQHASFGIHHHAERVDAARPWTERESSMDGPGYVREVLIAARHRMDRELSGEHSQQRPRRLRPINSERFGSWWRRLVSLWRRGHRADVTGPPVSVSGPASVLPARSHGTSSGTRPILDNDNDRLRKAFRSLQAEDSQLLTMRHVDQLSTAQIAFALGITDGAAKQRLLRALLRLRELIESRA